ncbi:Outer membrane protein assembly factor BamB precursor [Rubripirellula amarantea]|uniref:Outer membrane protein assembly factor BamB n=1 Tax=Rubripirellula amarantea TaxID=2527999 RepID=A0A5C5WVC2_9BACT|nr:PQQ-binding-like beta-propeller repeat protein [Rubripirellula amarantea]TWT54071.1 Outer membrane protein assembly factor BamB precursor [Rubripirellula amarantea]
MILAKYGKEATSHIFPDMNVRSRYASIFALLFSLVIGVPGLSEEVPATDQPATTSLPKELSLLWEYEADEAIESSPTIADDKVFIADALGKIYAVTLSDGTEIWKRNFDTGFVSSPAIKNQSLVIGDVEGNLYALDISDGSTKWQASTEGEINGTAAFFGDLVLVTSQDGKLYGYNLADGSNKWTYETEDQIRCSPAIAGDRTFLGGCDGRLHMVDLNTGKAIGEPFPLGGPTGSTPTVFGNRAYLPIMDGAVFAFDWQKPEQLWRYEDDERVQEYRNSAAANERVVIVSSARKQVDAISIETGERLWRHTLRRRADATPLIVGDDVFIAGTDGRLLRLSLADGQERSWSYEVRGSFLASPTVWGAKLLIADDNGVLRCFGPKSESAIESATNNTSAN